MPARNAALEQEWRERLERHGRSGLTAVKFAEQEGVPVHQLTWWRRELKRRDSVLSGETPQPSSKPTKKKRGQAKRAKPAPAFVPVSVTATTSTSSSSIEIVLDQRLRIAVSPGFDGELLRQVIQALEQSPC